MTGSTLGVWLGQRRVGSLERRGPRRMRFTYAPEVVAAEIGAPLLSVHLPVRAEPFAPEPTGVVFDGLLPEDHVRRRVAERLRLPEMDSFALLERIGRDCAGAVAVLAEGEAPHLEPPAGLDWLEGGRLAEHLLELPTRPFALDDAGEVRLSLGGVQGKLLVVRSDGRTAIAAHGHASTHIIKPHLPPAPDLVANEAYCMWLAAATGVPTASVRVTRFAEVSALEIARYDRVTNAVGKTLRTHQEDGCQALGIRSDMKYFDARRSRQPRWEHIYTAALPYAVSPARLRLGLFDLAVTNFVLGNSDAHAKNVSLMHLDRRVSVAPAYDIVCTQAYGDRFTRTLGMPIGDRVDPDTVTIDDVRDLADRLDLGAGGVNRRVSELVGRIAVHRDEQRARVVATDADTSIIAAVDAVIDARSAQLST